MTVSPRVADAPVLHASGYEWPTNGLTRTTTHDVPAAEDAQTYGHVSLRWWPRHGTSPSPSPWWTSLLYLVDHVPLYLVPTLRVVRYQ